MPIPVKHQALVERVLSFEFDRDPKAPFTFTKRVSKRNNFADEYTERVKIEFLKYVCLVMMTGRTMVPSVWVDEVWHILLMYTNTYYVRLCHDILGRVINHDPGNGKDADEEMFGALYAQTLEDYEFAFGPPPEDIWGHPHVRPNWREIAAKQNRPQPPASNGDGLAIFQTTPGLILPGQAEEVLGKLKDFQFDEDPTAPYLMWHRVMKRNNWEPDYTQRGLVEYLKYQFINWYTGQQVAPSRWIDEIQHVHLMYTKNYWVKMCRDIFGTALHHRPGNGSVGEAEENAAKVANCFVHYERFFGTPPADLWGEPQGVGWRKLVLAVPLPAKMKVDVLEMFPRDSDEAIP